MWNKKTGIPVSRAIVWQCRRSFEICSRLKEEGREEFFRNRTGLLLDPYFSGTKIRWLLDQDPELNRMARKGEILFGTVDTWLLWKLTGGRVHATDVSNASRTLLMNIHTGKWDQDILDILDIPAAILPEIRDSIGFFGETDPEIFGRSIPITAMAGDQQSALFGHRAFAPGEMKNTYGTGCFMLMNVGDKPVISSRGLLSTVAWGYGNRLTYALEGSIFMAGAILQWLRDDLKLVSDVEEINRLAEQAGDAKGVYLIPAYQGLGSPWWRPDARGAILGLTRASGRAEVCRASLEAIAYRTRDVINVMVEDSGRQLLSMKVDGGVTNSDVLMQFQSDLLGIPVERPRSVEATALGAALMAGIGTGLWSGIEDLRSMETDSRVFAPSMSEEQREGLYRGWLEAVKKIL
jgi:glycerol kinase